jgi:Proteasome subunit
LTLLVGIRCTDGVVIAADSAVTFGVSANQHTIRDNCQKIYVIDDHVIWAGTGEVGLGQRFATLVRGACIGRKPDVTKETIGTDLCRETLKNFQSTGVQGGFGALLACCVKRSPELCEFAFSNFQPEWKTSASTWYASMGSGQPLADPYLRLLRGIFWKSGPPTLSGGRFAAMWVLRQAIDASFGYIGDPISMAVLECTEKDRWKARMLTSEELEEHAQSVKASSDHFAQYQYSMRGDPTSAPEIPAAPSDSAT